MIRSNVRPFTIVLAALGFAACGASISGRDQGHVALVGNYVTGVTQGFDIGTGHILEDAQSDPNADFYLSMKMIISLYAPTLPAGKGGFCSVAAGPFQHVTDIPESSLGSCNWTLLDLGGNAPHAQSTHAGSGYLVKDRDDAFVAKLLITRDTVDDDGGVEIAFDICPPTP